MKLPSQVNWVRLGEPTWSREQGQALNTSSRRPHGSFPQYPWLRHMQRETPTSNIGARRSDGPNPHAYRSPLVAVVTQLPVDLCPSREVSPKPLTHVRVLVILWSPIYQRRPQISTSLANRQETVDFQWSSIHTPRAEICGDVEWVYMKPYLCHEGDLFLTPYHIISSSNLTP